MRINHKSLAVGVAALALAALSGGGIAWATTDGPAPSGPGDSSLHCSGGEASPMNAVADYLGLSRTELIDQMQSGRSLAEIAKAQGKTVTGLKTAMLRAMKGHLAADTDLTAAQRTALLAMMRSHLSAMVADGHMSGMDPDDMHGGMMDGVYGDYGGMMDGDHGGMMDGVYGDNGGMMDGDHGGMMDD